MQQLNPLSSYKDSRGQSRKGSGSTSCQLIESVFERRRLVRERSLAQLKYGNSNSNSFRPFPVFFWLFSRSFLAGCAAGLAGSSIDCSARSSFEVLLLFCPEQLLLLFFFPFENFVFLSTWLALAVGQHLALWLEIFSPA